MNYAIITPEQSDVYLARFADWIALDDPTKVEHISRASVYVQTQWSCVDTVVFEDDPDTDEVEEVAIPDEIMKATAEYAYVDFQGNLYGDPATDEDPHGNLRSQSDQVGDLKTEISWYKGGAQSSYGTDANTGFPDSLMSTYCKSTTYGTTEVIRV